MVVGAAQRTHAAGGLAAPDLLTVFQQIADASNIPIVGPLLQKYGSEVLGPSGVAIASALLITIFIWWFLRVIRNRKVSTLVRKEKETEEHE